MVPHPSRVSGYASILTMILLVVGFTLCMWLYTSLGNATAITRNELQHARAQMAAETGLDAVRYELKRVTATTGFRRTPSMVSQETIDRGLLEQLCKAVEDYYAQGTMPGPLSVDTALPRLVVGPVDLADGCQFQAELTMLKRPDDYGHGYTLQVTGISGHGSRTICMDMAPDLLFGSSSMDFPIATRGRLNIAGAAEIYRYDPETGADLSDVGRAVNLTSEGPGFLCFADTPDPDLEMPPIFPSKYLSSHAYEALDTMVMSGALTTTTSMSSSLRNIYIPPSSGKKPPPVVFPDNCVIEGIVYVGWPNRISFGDNVVLNGVIIYEKAPEEVTDKESPSMILLDRANNVSGAQAAAASTIGALLTSAGYLDDEKAMLTAELSEWLIHAPDTDFDLENGNTTNQRIFEGNFHIRNLGKSTGSGNAEPNNLIIRGQILCEGDVDLGGNRVFCIEPPDATDNPEAARRLLLNVGRGSYWEPVQ